MYLPWSLRFRLRHFCLLPNTAFPWTVFSSDVLKRAIYFLFSGGFSACTAWSYVVTISSSALPALLLRLSLLQFSSALCCADHRAWPFLSIKINKFSLTGLVCHYPALSAFTQFQTSQSPTAVCELTVLFSVFFCQGIFRHALWLFFIPDIFSLNTPGRFFRPSVPFPVLSDSFSLVILFGNSSFTPVKTFTSSRLQRSSAWIIEIISFHCL